MPSNITFFNALLSSPTGLEPDRSAVRRAIEEVNRALRSDGLGVEVRDWVRDVRPTVGKDGQDVVNNQICDTCDLAIVLVHDRVGSPTPRFESGTIEEAELVLERKSKGDNVDLLVFFKKPNVELNEVTLGALQRVLVFRRDLEERGVLWKEYIDTDELERSVRLYLPECIRILGRGLYRPQDAVETIVTRESNSTRNASTDADDEGALDFEISFHDAMSAIANALARIQASNERLTEGLTSDAQRLTTLTSGPARDPHAIRSAINSTSRLINEYNSNVREDVETFRWSIPQMSSALISLVSMSDQDTNSEDSDIADLRGVISQSRSQVLEALRAIEGQRDSLAGLPRMTKELNAAKREGTTLLTELGSLWERLIVELDEVVGAIDRRLGH